MSSFLVLTCYLFSNQIHTIQNFTFLGKTFISGIFSNFPIAPFSCHGTLNWGLMFGLLAQRGQGREIPLNHRSNSTFASVENNSLTVKGRQYIMLGHNSTGIPSVIFQQAFRNLYSFKEERPLRGSEQVCRTTIPDTKSSAESKAAALTLLSSFLVQLISQLSNPGTAAA